MRLSQLHPLIYEARVRQLRLERDLGDRLARVPFARGSSGSPLPFAMVRHRSLLRRRLGSSDPRLQETKIVNLGLAAAALDGLLIHPGEVASFWERVGPPTAARGFVEGLLLAGGEVRSGVGGGLCQASNLLYWMALHAPLAVVERHRHGFDPFPDEGRVLPFGSGATVFYNYVDLRLANPTDQTFQLRVWVSRTHLCGMLLTERAWPLSYHVEERAHRFLRDATGRVYRENELWRTTIDRRTGALAKTELVARNHCEVKYPVSADMLAG